MPSDVVPPRLDHEIYSGSADKLTTFYRALPKHAVRDLALEGFRRLVERRNLVVEAPCADIVHDTIERLCQALISPDSEASVRASDAILETHPVEEFYLVYLSGAASRLGEWWEQDQVTFFDVTVGLGRLHAMVRSIEQPIKTRPNRAGRKKAIFATVPGEKHTLGVAMATDLFRRRGWHILLLVGLEHEALLSRVTQADANTLGVSAGGAHAAAALARLLVDLRIVRPECRIFVSGQIVSEARSLVEAAMPDGIAESVDDAERLLNLFASQSEDRTGTSRSSH